MKKIFLFILFCGINLTSRAADRPQTPTPPFPYTEEEVTFHNPASGIDLAGTLTIPGGDGKFPAVALVTGSGAQDRDETIADHKPFRVIADYLTRRGIVVLRYDDRGTAASGGDISTASVHDLATDARAALEYLRSRPEVDKGRAGIVGHSEGGSIAFMAAATGDPDFIITLAGPGIRGHELMIMQRDSITAAYGDFNPGATVNQKVITRAQEMILEISDHEELTAALTDYFKGRFQQPMAERIVARLTSPELLDLIRYDPAMDFPNIECPVLSLNGSKDTQVPARPNLEGILTGLTAAGNDNITVKEYPGLNHLFQTAQTGLPDEYGRIEETFNEQVMRDMADWILLR